MCVDICEEDWVATHLVRPNRIRLHPAYDPDTQDSDVAVLVLRREIRLGPRVWLVSLPPAEATADCQHSEPGPDWVERAGRARGCGNHNHDQEYQEYADTEEEEEEYYYEAERVI